jgi:hypothetical protein
MAHRLCPKKMGLGRYIQSGLKPELVLVSGLDWKVTAVFNKWQAGI